MGRPYQAAISLTRLAHGEKQGYICPFLQIKDFKNAITAAANNISRNGQTKDRRKKATPWFMGHIGGCFGAFWWNDYWHHPVYFPAAACCLA
jgi:hypothetical protein